MNSTELLALAQKIAKHLPGWRVNTLSDYKHNAYFIGPNKEQFFISNAAYNQANRLRVYPSIPDLYQRYDQHLCSRLSDYSCCRGKNFSIGLSATKGAKAIATDIKRRFLPVFLTVLPLIKKEHTEHIAKADHLKNRLDLIKRVCPSLYNNYKHPRSTNEIYTNYNLRGHINNIIVDIHYYLSNNDISLDLRYINDEQLIKILAILNPSKK